jgi:hypothetical protein
LPAPFGKNEVLYPTSITFLILPNGAVSLPALVLQYDRDTSGHLQLSEFWEQCGFIRSGKKQAIAKSFSQEHKFIYTYQSVLTLEKER